MGLGQCLLHEVTCVEQLTPQQATAVVIIIASWTLVATLVVGGLFKWVLKIPFWSGIGAILNVFENIPNLRLVHKSRLERDSSDEPESYESGFLPDRNAPHWEVNAGPNFNGPNVPTVVGERDGSGWVFKIPVYVRNAGWRPTPAFTLEVLSKRPYNLRDYYDPAGNRLGEARKSELTTRDETWWVAPFKHYTPVTAYPVFIGTVTLTIHGANVPQTYDMKWRVALTGRRFYPGDSLLWFNVRLITPPQPQPVHDDALTEAAEAET
jgi:hypothetical protein